MKRKIVLLVSLLTLLSAGCAYADLYYWACSKCGVQQVTGSSLPPPAKKCPLGGYHVWFLQSRT